MSKTTPKTTYHCAICGRKMTRWIVGKHRTENGIPRYCFVGEGCNKPKGRKRS